MRVTWEAVDAVSGVDACTLEVQEDDGAWETLSTSCAGGRACPSTGSGQVGEPGRLYAFRFSATDNACNKLQVGNEASAEAQASAPRVRKYYYHAGKRVAVRVDERGGDAVYYLHGDHLGSTSLVTDETGDVHSRQLYYPYGAERYTEGALPTDFTFTGQRKTPGLGLMHYGARYYHPLLGRFISADTVVPNPSNPQALNRYRYAGNNPVLYCDPDGHCEAVCATIILMAALVGTLIIARESIEPPPEPGEYDPRESYQQATGLVEEFRSNEGPLEREFGSTSSLTQDIRDSSGMEEFRQKFAEAGYPPSFKWHHHLDVREEEAGPYPIRFAKSLPAYIGAQVKLGLTAVGIESNTPAGPIDALDGTIGSLDTIRAERVGRGWAKIEVENRMDWESGLRIPGSDESLAPRKILGTEVGEVWAGIFGGTRRTEQRFYWWERIPDQ